MKGIARLNDDIARHHATSDKVFEDDETEFLVAMDQFKRRHNKQFPTLCDVLSVVRDLGYAKRRVRDLVSIDSVA